MVGAWRFELQTSCAQGRRVIFWKPFFYNAAFENKSVIEIFGSGSACVNVTRQAQGPLNFPLSKTRAKGVMSGKGSPLAILPTRKRK